MMRGWIIALAVASCTGETLLAQDGAGTRSRYQFPQAQRRTATPRYHADPAVRPAAAAAEQARRPRAPRETSQQNTGKSSSFFGKLKLPNLLPSALRSDDDADQRQASDAPLPYDPADLGPQRRTPKSQPARSPASRSAASAAKPSARPAAEATSPLPTSRIARSSPAPSTRRNELAEALSGLTPSTQVDADAEVANEPSELAADESLTPPSVDESEELPSYLREPAVAKTAPARSPAPRTQAQPHRDLRDALLSDDADDASEVAVNSEPPAGSGDALPSPPMPSTVAPRPAVPATVAEDKAAAAFRPRPAAAPQAPATAGNPVASKPSSANTSLRESAVLFTSQQPQITSNIEGPQRIVVGRQAEYRVTVENKGTVAARDLVAAILPPAGAEVIDASASNGTVDRAAAEPAPADTAAASTGEIRWQLYELPPGATQTLTLQLVPRSGREMQLGVQLTHAPTTAQAVVEIQEPKLAMEISGPAEVLYGKSQRYGLTLTNPGNGAAEDVAIQLTPPGGDKASVVRHKVGSLAPGESKKIELELTAREAGELKIQAIASAAGDLKAETVKTVLCRKAELQVDWRGPDKKYAGAVATYYFRVRNPGTAAADNVAVKVNLPAGAELVEASDGHEWDADRRVLVWAPAGLGAGEERFMEVQCRMSQPGVNKLELSAQTAGGDLSDAKSVPVTVEALADLKLEVADPQGVVPVGETAVYEIRIQNRGMTAAKGVNIVAMFSAGIDPSHVEGGQHAIRDGRVAFRAVDLAAGSDTVLKIHAKATQAGTHVFRAEVACEELEVKLAAEETTRFFSDDSRWADASTAYADEASTTTR